MSQLTWENVSFSVKLSNGIEKKILSDMNGNIQNILCTLLLTLKYNLGSMREKQLVAILGPTGSGDDGI